MVGKLLPEVTGKRPVGRPPKHGLYSKFALGPLTEVKQTQVMELLSGQRHLMAPSDELLVGLLARTLAQLELISRYIHQNGFFQDEASGSSRGTVSPLVGQFFNAVKVASKLCDQLGLSPESRVRLSRNVAQTGDVASRIADARGDSV